MGRNVMKKMVRGWRWALCALLAMSATPVWADEGYYGFKVGSMVIDHPSDEMMDLDPLNLGFYVGGDYAQAGVASFGAEFELTATVVPGEFEDGDYSEEWRVNTGALYAAFRFGGKGYGKVRVGVLWEKVSVDRSVDGWSLPGWDTTETGLSFGGGGGFAFANGNRMEFELTVVDQDIVALTFGILF